MNTKTMEIENCKIKFENETWETKTAWGHKSKLFIDDVEIDTNKVVYFNRTWERYSFQTCMIGLVYKLIQDAEKEFISNKKYIYNIKRLRAEIKEEFLEEFNKREDVKMYYKIIEELK